VGVFAAPCIGPPVVALLALVGARGDPWFGFAVFFTLSLGLGAPYLVLGTFSNLLRNLPRSGEWMVWVERALGVILLGVGLFYGMLGIAPKQAGWVVPVMLVAGGVYLGFIERSANARRGFRWMKRLAGAAAVAGGLFIVGTTPVRGIEFREGSLDALQGAVARGRPVLVDFTADWCVACHELERSTFTHPTVIEVARLRGLPGGPHALQHPRSRGMAREIPHRRAAHGGVSDARRPRGARGARRGFRSGPRLRGARASRRARGSEGGARVAARRGRQRPAPLSPRPRGATTRDAGGAASVR
jgi:hypothetical protein